MYLAAGDGGGVTIASRSACVRYTIGHGCRPSARSSGMSLRTNMCAPSVTACAIARRNGKYSGGIGSAGASYFLTMHWSTRCLSGSMPFSRSCAATAWSTTGPVSIFLIAAHRPSRKTTTLALHPTRNAWSIVRLAAATSCGSYGDPDAGGRLRSGAIVASSAATHFLHSVAICFGVLFLASFFDVDDDILRSLSILAFSFHLGSFFLNFVGWKESRDKNMQTKKCRSTREIFNRRRCFSRKAKTHTRAVRNSPSIVRS
jgi:hypothetical protein